MTEQERLALIEAEQWMEDAKALIADALLTIGRMDDYTPKVQRHLEAALDKMEEAVDAFGPYYDDKREGTK